MILAGLALLALLCVAGVLIYAVRTASPQGVTEDAPAGVKPAVATDELDRRPVAPSNSTMESDLAYGLSLNGWYTFHTKVAGVSFRNDDGTSRQAFLKRCKPGDELELVWDEGNPYDANATKVITLDGLQLGYLDRRTAVQVHKGRLLGEQWICFVEHAGSGDNGLWGMVILLARKDE